MAVLRSIVAPRAAAAVFCLVGASPAAQAALAGLTSLFTHYRMQVIKLCCNTQHIETLNCAVIQASTAFCLLLTNMVSGQISHLECFVEC